jgi:hypothetical protein
MFIIFYFKKRKLGYTKNYVPTTCLEDLSMAKNKSLKVRVTQDEHTAIHAIAKSNGLTLSEFIRNLANPISCDLIKNG